MKPQIIRIRNCNNGSGCGSKFGETPWWGSKEGIAAGENKRVRVFRPITDRIKKAA